MKVDPIQNPLPGERMIDVMPEPKPAIGAWWHRRLNLFTGRSLSDTALSAEQTGRAGRLALWGQMLSSGVVSGLEVDIAEEDLLWFSDELPIGATPDEAFWDWVSVNPIPYSGQFAIQFSVSEGWQQRGFVGTTTRLVIKPGDTLIAYVYLDSEQTPSEIMLQWHEWKGDWEHRAYWGANEIDLGTDETDSRRRLGNLPDSGRWIRLEVPARLVGLESKIVDGIRFAVSEGRATWDFIGKARSLCHLSGGFGIAASGEDVVVPQTLRVAVSDLPVYAPVSILQGSASQPASGNPGVLLPRQLGESLGELIVSGIAANLPHVGILLLQPITTRIIGNPIPDNGCHDPQDNAFNDEQLIDGCRLVLYPWATEWLPLPEPGDRWRNRLAYTLFNQELKNNDQGKRMPWQDVGVPIALIGFDNEWNSLFVDSYAVRRQGGKPKTRTALVPNAGNPFLWQARIQQFAEELAELDVENTPIPELVQRFRYLPPVGLLPKDAIAPRRGKDFFFPSAYSVQAAPVPLEQLDTVVQASASLVSFDLFTPDQVQVLIPVPQSQYDPNLLKIERIDPEFQQTIKQLLRQRTQWLYRRQLVRDRANAIYKAIKGKLPEYPADLDQQADEGTPVLPFASTRVLSGSGDYIFNDATDMFTVNAGDVLSFYVYVPLAPTWVEIEVWWIQADSIVRKTGWVASSEPDDADDRTIPMEQWVRLEQTARELDLEGATLYGIGVRTSSPIAWGHVGKLTSGVPDAEITLWFGDTLPEGAQILKNGGWTWVEALSIGTPPTAIEALKQEINTELARRQKPFVSFRALITPDVAGEKIYVFKGMNPQPMILTGETLTAYVYLDPLNPPDRIEFWWLVDDNNGRLLRASWGTPSSWGEVRVQQPLPPLGRWVQLRVPSQDLWIDDAFLDGITLVVNSGRVAIAHIGRSFRDNDGEEIWVGNELAPGAKVTTSDGWTWSEIQESFTPFGESLPLLPDLTEADYETAAADGDRTVIPFNKLISENLNQEPIATEVRDLKLKEIGLEEFIKQLEVKLEKANDKINFSFLRVQTDIYRIRQLVLGSDVASRLTTSPGLAAIAQEGKTARATHEQLNKYYEQALTTQIPQQAIPIVVESAASSPLSTPNVTNLSSGSPSLMTMANIDPENFSAFSDATFATVPFVQPIRVQPIFTQPGMVFQPGITLDSSLAIIRDNIELQPKRPVKDIIDKQTIGTVIEPIKAKLKVTIDDVIEQAPIVGQVIPTTTVGERLRVPAAVESKQFTDSGRFEVVSNLLNIGINLGDAEIPGIREKNTNVKFNQLKDAEIRAQVLNKILRGEYNKVPDNEQFEARYFAEGIRGIDDTVATLRIAEGVVQKYRLAIAACKKTLETLQNLTTQVNQRLTIVGNELSETRHDLAVARTLLADEQLRIKSINEKRDRILHKNVNFLVFHRPRVADTIVPTPVRALNPGIREAPIPACLGRNVQTPAELRALVDLLRDVPVRWFNDIPRLLDRFDRMETLYTAIQSAKLRANTTALQAILPTVTPTTHFGQAITQVVMAQQQTVMQYRLQTAQLNVNAIVGQTWKQTRNQAEALLALGDLIDARHGRSEVTQRATQELNNIAHVAGCLYANFTEVLPIIRLEWAQLLSQYDAPVNLRNLASLPRWGELPYLERRETQSLVDWLYQRIDPRQDTALALINDLVRLCILLASHAPVNQIISGRVAQQTTVSQGGRVELAINPALIRIGMQVLLYSSENQVIAQGVVEDLGADRAAAKVLQTVQPNLQLAQNTRVQVLEAIAPISQISR